MICLRLLRPFHQRPFNIFTVSSTKYITNHPIKFLETQERWKEKDGISKRWQLIYKASMDNLLKYVSTYLTFSTATVACGTIYYAAFVFDKSTMNNPVVLGDDVVIANSGIECLVYLGAFILFHAAVKILLSKYVLRLYQNGDNYIAIFRGNTFNSIKKHEFKLEEFKKLKPILVVSWGDARFRLGQKQAIILENYFKTPEYFNYLLYKKKAEGTDDEE